MRENSTRPVPAEDGPSGVLRPGSRQGLAVGVDQTAGRTPPASSRRSRRAHAAPVQTRLRPASRAAPAHKIAGSHALPVALRPTRYRGTSARRRCDRCCGGQSDHKARDRPGWPRSGLYHRSTFWAGLKWLQRRVCVMGPTSGKPTGRRAGLPGIGCESWAICSDLALLGWTAIDPCASCVGTAIGRLAGHVPDTENPGADPARLVTGDELDALLSQARRALPGGSTSSP